MMWHLSKSYFMTWSRSLSYAGFSPFLQHTQPFLPYLNLCLLSPKLFVWHTPFLHHISAWNASFQRNLPSFHGISVGPAIFFLIHSCLSSHLSLSVRIIYMYSSISVHLSASKFNGGRELCVSFFFFLLLYLQYLTEYLAPSRCSIYFLLNYEMN